MKERCENPAKLLFSLSEAVLWREKLRENSKRLVVTNGCFDILHRGHAEYLQRAALLGDALLILVNSDESVRNLKGPSRPLSTETDRAYILGCLGFVDALVIFNSMRCTAEVRALRPDIYVKGGDYDLEKMNAEEKAALLEAGSEIIFIPFVGSFSTSGIIKKMNTGTAS